MIVVRRFGLAGAAQATGAVAVIDTFRAFSTAAYLFDRRIGRLVLTSTLDEARRVGRGMESSLLCGEEGGRRPDDFDLGNSPGEVLERKDLAGRTVVLRTSAGTRCLRAAFESGASPVFAASLVVASATTRSLSPAEEVSIVASGRHGVEPADEDEATADLIGDLLIAKAVDTSAVVDEVRTGRGARRLETATWAHPDDVSLCLNVDAFPFAMEAVAGPGTIELRPRLV